MLYQMARALTSRLPGWGRGGRPGLNPAAAMLALPLMVVASALVVACGAPTQTPPATPAPTVAPASEAPAPGPTLRAVATTTVLADLTRNVGGDLVEVTSIVPPGTDVHSFQTTPSHSRSIGDAGVIISNGFGLDVFLDPLLASNMRAGAVHVVAAQGLTPEALEELAFPGGHMASAHLQDHLAEEIDELIHRAEAGEISPTEALDRIKQLLTAQHEHADAHGHDDHGHDDHDTHGHNDHGHDDHDGLDHDDHGHEHETLVERLLELVHEVEEGHLSPEAALEAMEELLEQLEGHGHEHGHGHDHSAGDPHFWLDPLLAIHYVESIRDGFMEADPANAEVYLRNAGEYIQQLRDLDQEIAQTLSQVPPQYRHLVTFHDAFGYFARRYGWRVSAFVPSDATEVTPRAVVQVMERIRAEGIPAVFAEPQFGAGVLEQAARDTGVRVGVIYSDALGGEVGTYIEMMRANARSLAEHLR